MYGLRRGHYIITRAYMCVCARAGHPADTIVWTRRRRQGGRYTVATTTTTVYYTRVNVSLGLRLHAT